MLGLAARALEHFEHQTTDLAPDIMQQPIAAYIDKTRYQAKAFLNSCLWRWPCL